MNFLWIDCETSGRFADKHDIIQLACIPVINGQHLQSFNEFCQPLSYENVEKVVKPPQNPVASKSRHSGVNHR